MRNPYEGLPLCCELDIAIQAPLWMGAPLKDRKRSLLPLVRKLKPLGFPAGRLLRIVEHLDGGDLNAREARIDQLAEALPAPNRLADQLQKDPDWERWNVGSYGYLGADEAEETRDLSAELSIPLANWDVYQANRLGEAR